MGENVKKRWTNALINRFLNHSTKICSKRVHDLEMKWNYAGNHLETPEIPNIYRKPRPV